MALRSKIKKDKSLSSNPSVLSALATEIPPEPSTTNNTDPKIDSRLLSSKALASDVNAFVQSLRLLLDPQSRETVASESSRPAKVHKHDDDNYIKEPASEGGKQAVEVGEEETGEDALEVAEDDGWESGTVDEHHDEDDHDDDSGDDSQDSDVPQEKAKRGSKAKATPASAVKERPKPTESAFLPSLSVGFTRGDSDSEFSEAEAEPTERKNRRGQRARRA